MDHIHPDRSVLDTGGCSNGLLHARHQENLDDEDEGVAMPSQLQGMVEDLLKSQNKQTGDIATLIAKVENLERGVTGLPGELPLRDRLAAIEREIRVRKETWDRAVIDQQEIRKNRRLVWMALFTALLGFALSIAGSVLLHYMFHIAK